MKVEVAIGEVVDKITILMIKENRISDENRLTDIRKELEILKDALLSDGLYVEEEFYTRLKNVNEKIWDTEEKLRLDNIENKDYILAARENAEYNDKRFLIKSEVNIKYDSLVKEQKAHNQLYTSN